MTKPNYYKIVVDLPKVDITPSTDECYASYVASWINIDNPPLSHDEWEFLCRVWDKCYDLLWEIEKVQPGKAWPAIQHLEYWLGC